MKFWDCQNLDMNKIGNMSQVAGLRRYEFTEGKAKGVEAVEVHTGSGLTFTVLPGRGMDIAWSEYRGVPLSYMSKTGIVSPAYYESCGMNWLYNFFAGALTTCGLLNVGGPETVNHPVIGERGYGLHGRITNCAAEQVSLYEEWENGEYIMKVSGVMQEGILHGEHLSLRREITAKLGCAEFTICDTITNHGATEQDMMLLYHINMGYPLLNHGSRLITNSDKIIPANDEAERDMDKVFSCENPVLGTTERCYAHDMHTDEVGKVRVALVNDELELGVALEYNKGQLPCFNQWKMQNQKEYVVGLEPCTALPQGIGKAKENGTVQTLQPGESKKVEITYKILDGKAAITSFESSVKR